MHPDSQTPAPLTSLTQSHPIVRRLSIDTQAPSPLYSPHQKASSYHITSHFQDPGEGDF